ncbi:MAG: hypothetical protein ACRDBY_12970 [Cetobacterium sp.]
MEKLFEKALIGKYRYNYKGLLTTEDLFDLTLKELDFIYTGLSTELKKVENVGLLSVENKDTQTLKNKMEIVQHVFTTKKEAIESDRISKENKAKKQQIMELIEKKRVDSLQNMTEAQLQELLGKL